jgi:hypothetical protein
MIDAILVACFVYIALIAICELIEHRSFWFYGVVESDKEESP